MRLKELFNVAGLLVGLGVIAVATTGCRSDTEVVQRTQGAGDFGMAEAVVPMSFSDPDSVRREVLNTLCDTQEFRDMADRFVKASREEQFEPAEAVLTSASNLNNGMVHDCQRLIANDTLGPLVALLVDTIDVADGNFTDGVIVADIVNYSGPEYAPLNITPGISCLWLQQDGDEWVAAIRQPNTGDCASYDFDDRPPNVLEVHRLQILAPRDTVYPKTGRWMWDARAGVQFIGVRCGDGWCEIGLPDFDGTQQIPTFRDVPGRWDAQYLSLVDSTMPGNPLRRTGLWGRIEPGQDNQAAESSWPEQAWSGNRHVATMHFRFPGPPQSSAWDGYADKFVFSQGPPATVNVLMRKTIQGGAALYEVKTPGSQWTEVNRCDMPHSGTGTVRWAWSEDDEGLWVPCDRGCCMTNGRFMR